MYSPSVPPYSFSLSLFLFLLFCFRFFLSFHLHFPPHHRLSAPATATPHLSCSCSSFHIHPFQLFPPPPLLNPTSTSTISAICYVSFFSSPFSVSHFILSSPLLPFVTAAASLLLPPSTIPRRRPSLPASFISSIAHSYPCLCPCRSLPL